MNTEQLFIALTKILIITTVVIWVLWDLYVVILFGREATESYTITKWCRRFPWIVFALGYLCGHWIGFSL
jgi:hypothetical protein